MIRNSVKQMLRTPIKAILFLILMTASVILLTMGVNLFFISERIQEQIEATFITMGTVEQRAVSTAKERYWDPYT